MSPKRRSFDDVASKGSDAKVETSRGIVRKASRLEKVQVAMAGDDEFSIGMDLTAEDPVELNPEPRQGPPNVRVEAETFWSKLVKIFD
jgi:hypothetical protein